MTSVWLDKARPAYPPVTPGERYDVLVIGAGLTGLTTALLLARAGVAVGVLEAGTVGAGTTGNTTAKISLLQGTRLSSIRGKHSAATVRQYVDGNREGQAWLLRYCDDHGVDYQIRPSYTYATTDKGRRSVMSELRACQEAGLPVVSTTDVELPYAVTGAVRLDGQAQFDPLDALIAMATDLVDRGGVIHENSRVREVKPGIVTTAVTDHGAVQADRVVLATGVPIMDRGGFFARLEPLRSYAATFRIPGAVPQGMYLSADSPDRTVRSVPHTTGDGGAEELLLTGGNGHVVGRHAGTAGLVDDLVGWTRQHYPGAELTHSWSAQDYHSDHELPFVGPLLPHDNRILVATGFAKWGMTNAVAASLALAGLLLGGHTEWAAAMRSWSTAEVSGALSAARVNASVGLALGTGWLKPLACAPDKLNPAEGHGRVERGAVHPSAVCTVDGQTFRRSAVCTHLHGVVSWNDAERSWDCPLHGSRFRPDGSVIEGPATKDLPQR